jgi:hypothetical protein
MLGLIIGVVVGSTVLVVIIIVGVIYYLRRRAQIMQVSDFNIQQTD